MSQEQEYSLPTDIVQAGIDHAKEKYGLFLDSGTLVDIYKEIRDRRRVLRKLKEEDPSIHVAMNFPAAREHVLTERYPRTDPQADLIYRAHSSALGKMMSEFRARNKKKKPPQKRTAHDRLMDRVTLDSDQRQTRMIL